MICIDGEFPSIYWRAITLLFWQFDWKIKVNIIFNWHLFDAEIFKKIKICMRWKYHIFVLKHIEVISSSLSPSHNVPILRKYCPSENKSDNFEAMATGFKPSLLFSVAETQSDISMPVVLLCQNQFVSSMLMWSTIDLWYGLLWCAWHFH